MLKFVYYQKFIKVEKEGTEGFPPTLIKCESVDQNDILKVCQDWLDALGLTSEEYTVSVRIH